MRLMHIDYSSSMHCFTLVSHSVVGYKSTCQDTSTCPLSELRCNYINGDLRYTISSMNPTMLILSSNIV